MSLSITRTFNKETNQVDFFSNGESSNERVNAAQVNLSRGGTKMYRLDNLQGHNGTGATWDGKGVHTDACLEAYINRCETDIAKAIEEALAFNPLKNSASVTVASVA